MTSKAPSAGRPALLVLVMTALAAGALATACGPTAATPAAQPGGHSATSAPPASSSSAPASPAPAAKPAKPDSCNVITQAEASGALGQPVKPPVRGHAFVEGGVACVFYGPDAPAGFSPDVPVGDTVRVVLVTGPDAKKYFDDYRSKVHAQPVPALGDAAYYDGFASISVLKGDAYVRIAVGVPSPLPAEKRLAAAALSRM